MNVNAVREKFGSVGRRIGSVFLLRAKHAQEFVRECEKYGIPIAGIEGFRIINGSMVQPIQEISTDLGAFSGDSWERTLEDLNEFRGADVWFEVVTELESK